MTGKIVGAIIGMLLLKGSPWGLLIGLILGHFYDMSVMPRRRRTTTGEALEIGVRIFRATYEVMGHVAKADGRVSEAEIAAAREVMNYMSSTARRSTRPSSTSRAARARTTTSKARCASSRTYARTARTCCAISWRSR